MKSTLFFLVIVFSLGFNVKEKSFSSGILCDEKDLKESENKAKDNSLQLTGMEESGDFQLTPNAVLEEIIRAAKTHDFSNLHKLCPPDGSNDGDTQKYICDIDSGSKAQKKEFISYFKDARITGEVVYRSFDGIEKAAVPFWFNHPGGESRSNETMNMIKMEGKWYLQDF